MAVEFCAEGRGPQNEDYSVSKRPDGGRKKRVKNFCVGSYYCDNNI